MVNTTHYIDDKYQRPTTLHYNVKNKEANDNMDSSAVFLPEQEDQAVNGHPKYIDTYVQD